MPKDFSTKRFSVAPGGRVKLSGVDPAQTPGFKGSGRGNQDCEEAVKLLKKDVKRLRKLQTALYAEGRRSLLVVLQALDTAGKDGTIQWVLGPLNPQGVLVHGFKKPTPAEAARDFLWRIHAAVPPRGMIGVFNRSHYEDILVPAVFKLLAPRELEPRYEQINAFERHLCENGVVIRKFFLHVSKAEQKRRLQARLDEPDKRWKFDPADLKMRGLWDEFQRAYEEIVARTSTAHAPWFVVPADNKWFRNALVARVLRETLEHMDPRYPKAAPGLEKLKIPD